MEIVSVRELASLCAILEMPLSDLFTEEATAESNAHAGTVTMTIPRETKSVTILF